MGQRHQVYVFTTNKEGKEKAYAYHNQWCYGTLPLRHLNRVIRFQKKAQEYLGIGESYQDETDKIQAILSLEIEEGYYGGYFSIIEEVAEVNKTEKNGYTCKEVNYKTIDPNCGDNNDGITIIHIDAKRKVSYCFMVLSECDEEGLEKAKPNIPLSAKEYVSLYYKKGGENWKGLDVDKVIKAIGNTKLLTLEQCKRLLPKFYQKELVEA